MAQVDTTNAAKLRNAILNILPYPRGSRHLSDIMQYCMPPDADKATKRFVEDASNFLGDQFFDMANSYFDREAPFQLEDILISGSVSEGMEKFQLKTGSLSDTDFMLILKNIKVSEEDQQKGNLAVRENTAFVNLYLTDGELIRTWGDFLETSTNTSGRNKLSSMKLKQQFQKNYTSSKPMFAPFAKQNVEAVDEGPSLVVCSHGDGDVANQSEPIVHFPTEEFDFVLAIKCDGWPLCAQEWRSRPRYWLNEDIVRIITESGFHIVCKSSSEGDFRLSFFNAEITLIKNLTALQHKTYRAFKSFVGHYKTKWSPNIKKIFCSYHLKTIVLWYCEKSDPKDWTEERVVGHLLSLIDELIFALKEKKLPMYFMPKYNLMEKMKDGRDVAEKITQLRYNLHLITEAVVAEESSMLDWVDFLLKTPLKGWLLEQNDFNQQIETTIDSVFNFWTEFFGKKPKSEDKKGEEKIQNFREMCMRSWKNHCDSVNSVGINSLLEEGLD